MQYLRPTSIKEALVALRNNGIVLAGGTVLVPEIKFAFQDARTLVDIASLPALRGVRFENEMLHIGAGARLSEIETDMNICRYAPAVARAAAAVGNPQVRRVATIGGNLAIGIPGADLPPALLALDAQVVLTTADIEKLYPLPTLLHHGIPPRHLITAIKIPVVPDVASGFRKYAWRRASGKTIVSVAAAVRLRDKVFETVRLTTGGSSRATRLTDAEKSVQGRPPGEKLIREAGRIAAEEASIEVDTPPGEAYRRQLIAAGVTELLMELASPTKRN